MQPGVEWSANASFIPRWKAAGQRRQDGEDHPDQGPAQDIEPAVLAVHETENEAAQGQGEGGAEEGNEGDSPGVHLLLIVAGASRRAKVDSGRCGAGGWPR